MVTSCHIRQLSFRGIWVSLSWTLEWTLWSCKLWRPCERPQLFCHRWLQGHCCSWPCGHTHLAWRPIAGGMWRWFLIPQDTANRGEEKRWQPVQCSLGLQWKPPCSLPGRRVLPWKKRTQIKYPLRHKRISMNFLNMFNYNWKLNFFKGVETIEMRHIWIILMFRKINYEFFVYMLRYSMCWYSMNLHREYFL